MCALHGSTIARDEKSFNSITRKPVKTETKYAAYRPIEPVCDQIVTKIEQGWSYRSVLKEYTLRVEALWLVVAQEIGRLRAENRALRARVRELECRRLMVATA